MVFNAKAFAKTNLFLKVLGKRDDGYHEIDTVMQSLSVHDDVSLELTENGITVTCDKSELSGEDNIAGKVCELFFEFAELKCGAKVHIVKRIPVAAGMGGGSADAAAVLLLLNKATGKNYPASALLKLAKQLGADVPFFLEGGCARATGIGEKLSKLDFCKMYFVFTKELEKQSTKRMYEILDSHNAEVDVTVDKMVSELKTGNAERVAHEIYNSFELCWDMNSMAKPFEKYEPSKVFLSGSGPTVGAVFLNKEQAVRCADELKANGYNAFYAESVQQGVMFE